MDDVASAQSENENLRKIRNRLMKWESQNDPLAALSAQQEEHLEVLTNLWNDDEIMVRCKSIRHAGQNIFMGMDFLLIR